MITGPIEISNLLNHNFVSMGPKIDAKITSGKYHYTRYLNNIRINKSFFLRPVKPKEFYDIILFLNLNKLLEPNNIPIFIMKMCNDVFSTYLSLAFFQIYVNLAIVIPVFKGRTLSTVVTIVLFSLLPVFSKMFEKLIHTRMYEFLVSNKLIYNKQFDFRASHSTTML